MIQELIPLILSTIHNPFEDDYMLLQWAVGMFICAIGIATIMRQKHRATLPALAFLYTVGSGALTLAFRRTTPFLSAASYATMSVFAITSFSLLMPITTIARFFVALPYFTVFNALIVVVGTLTGKLGVLLMQIPNLPDILMKVFHHMSSLNISPGNHGHIGLLNYSSMNGCLIAIGIPGIFYKFKDGPKRWLAALGLCLVAIGLSSSSIPYGVLFVVCMAWLLHKRNVHPLIYGVAFLFIIVFASVIEAGDLFNSAFRFDAYKIFMGQWIERAHWFQGTGLGTFQVIGPMIQKEMKFMVSMDPKTPSYFWFWLHSDWLQCLFELGVCGFVLYAALFANTMKRFWREGSETSGYLFSTLAGLGATAVFNFPFRYFVIAFLGGLIVAIAYRKS